MSFMNHVLQLTKSDLDKVDQLVASQFNSELTIVNQIGHYIVNSGGKKIRPMMAILIAKALNYSKDLHILSAAFIEFIHTATLLHDDVIDESDLRRGNPTSNSLFGNAISVLVGDYIYTRSFQLMIELNLPRALKVMSNATNAIVEGEISQLINIKNLEITENDYFDIIYNKTAKLFEANAQIIAIIADSSIEIENALKNYGKFIGTAFQIIDDLLDYDKNHQTSLGKNIGDDLREGKITLPLLHTFQQIDDKTREKIKNAILNGTQMEMLDEIIDLMHKNNSFFYAQECAKRESNRAIDAISILENSEYKQALIEIAHYIYERDK